MAGFSLPADRRQAADEGQGTQVDPDALRAFAAGASSHSTGTPMPWEQYDPDDNPTKNVSIRLNQYELEILRHMATEADISQSKLLRRMVIPLLLKSLEKEQSGQ